MNFESLTQRQQINRMRAAACRVLPRWPIKVDRLRLLNHGFNTTFGVDTADGERFALRINVNSRRTPANLAAEAAWLDALDRETDLRVPVPQVTIDDELSAEVHVAELSRSLPAVLMSWLPGPDLGSSVAPQRIRAIGRLTASLHEHAMGWQLPAGAKLPRFSDPLFNEPDRLTTSPEVAALGPDAVEVIAAALTRTGQIFTESAALDTVRPLHADLHGYNLKWRAGQIAVFDFDDSGLGVPLLDLAITTYYLRVRSTNHLRLADLLLSGYAEAAPVPPHTADQLEGLVAARNLLLINDVLANSTASIREMTSRYLRNSVRKLRHYLDTGRYDHHLDGLES
ncbi:MAG: phosphotransferase enzyme family protein [Nocardioides sp.]